MVAGNPPTLPIKATATAITAAQVIITGLNALVSITAPVTSEYVVLGGPPNKPTTVVARPSPSNVLKPGFSRYFLPVTELDKIIPAALVIPKELY